MELRFLNRGCLQSDNIAADRYHNRPLRKQFPPLIMPTMLRIETHQKRAKFVRHQSLTTMVVQVVLLSTLQPHEDPQSRLKCFNQYLSGNHETNNKWNPLKIFSIMNNIIPDNENCLMVHASSFKVPYFSKSGRSDNMFSLNGSGFSVYKGNFFVSQLNYYAQFVVHINRSMISSKYACCTLYVWSLYFIWFQNFNHG